MVDGGGDPGTKYPFIMQKDGQGALFGPGREDGPLPEFYEPMESPFEKHVFSAQRSNPVAFKAIGEVLAVADERFPFIGTTYRVTEHWQTGLMTRRCSWLVEAEPQVFAELDPELAKERGIGNGDVVRVSSARGNLLAKAIVTNRFQPMNANGKTVHMIGLPCTSAGWCPSAAATAQTFSPPPWATPTPPYRNPRPSWSTSKRCLIRICRSSY